MDRLQRQIIDLNGKVDQLHGIVECLSTQLTRLAPSEQPPSDSRVERFKSLTLQPPQPPQPPQPSYSSGRYNSFMEHKDVLMDDDEATGLMTTPSEQNIPADIQIRRLTAQLTAAYNRIAALEEQLLARRTTYY